MPTVIGSFWVFWASVSPGRQLESSRLVSPFPRALNIMQNLALGPDNKVLCILHTRILLMFCALMRRGLSGIDVAPPSTALRAWNSGWRWDWEWPWRTFVLMAVLCIKICFCLKQPAHVEPNQLNFNGQPAVLFQLYVAHPALWPAHILYTLYHIAFTIYHLPLMRQLSIMALFYAATNDSIIKSPMDVRQFLFS